MNMPVQISPQATNIVNAASFLSHAAYQETAAARHLAADAAAIEALLLAAHRIADNRGKGGHGEVLYHDLAKAIEACRDYATVLRLDEGLPEDVWAIGEVRDAMADALSGMADLDDEEASRRAALEDERGDFACHMAMEGGL